VVLQFHVTQHSDETPVGPIERGLQADYLGGPLHAHVQSMGTALEDVLGDAVDDTKLFQLARPD
jgi:hypothetical protein